MYVVQQQPAQIVYAQPRPTYIVVQQQPQPMAPPPPAYGNSYPPPPPPAPQAPVGPSPQQKNNEIKMCNYCHAQMDPIEKYEYSGCTICIFILLLLLFIVPGIIYYYTYCKKTLYLICTVCGKDVR